MFGFGKFLKDRKGAFAIQFALMVVPLCVCTGLAIDGGRAFLARFELESALDAAALAVGSTTTTGTDLNTVAQTYVDANFKAPHRGPIALTLTPGDTLIKLHGNVTIDTYFMPLVGQPSVTVSADSQVVRGGANVEVSLALDVTGSMAGTKITALKTAASDLVDTVVNDTQTPFYSKVALVPWAPNVYAGANADTMRGAVTAASSVTGATWQNGTSRTLATGTGWRVGGAGKTMTAATWKNGSAATITKITKASSKINVTVSANPSYTNGDTVYITGAGGSYTSLNSNKYKVADMTTSSPWTFNLQNVGTTTYTTPPSGSTNSTAGTSQKCFTTACEVQVTAASHGFSNGNFIYINGVTTSGSGTSFNSATGTSWTIGSVATNTFILTGTNGPAFLTYSSGGAASKCYDAACDFQVTTSTAHGYSTGDYVYISGAVVANSGTSLNSSSSAGPAWQIANASGSIFYLAGNGPSYKDWSSSGAVQKCFDSNCDVKLTSASHGLAVNDYVQIASIGGWTGLNQTSNTSYQIGSVPDGNSFVITAGPWGPSLSGSYTANTGSAQCLKTGCAKFRYTTAGGSTVIRGISNCVSERTGAQAYTDAAPSIAYLGRQYLDSSSNGSCVSGNAIVPMTSNKTNLKNGITNMVVGGSTAGEIGIAWGWYLVSPNWGSIWPNAENRPAAYGAKDTVKVVVLMTDGEFNMAHCNGVFSKDYGNGNSDSINCNATNGDPFVQAQTICTNIKAQKVTLYTVGFEVGTAPGAADFLTACATDSKHVFLAASETELKAAFKSIAKSISKLRISQ